MNIVRQMWLNFRISLRARAFKRGRKMGMSEEEARVYANGEHPPTPAELAYEREMRRKIEISN